MQWTNAPLYSIVSRGMPSVRQKSEEARPQANMPPESEWAKNKSSECALDDSSPNRVLCPQARDPKHLQVATFGLHSEEKDEEGTTQRRTARG